MTAGLRAENEVEETASQTTDASQVVRMPNSFEFARAVLGVPQLGSSLRWLEQLAINAYFVVTGVLWGLLVASILAGWLVFGVVVFVLAVAWDALATRLCIRETLLLRQLGVTPPLRTAIRGILLIALLAGLDQAATAVGIAAVLLCVLLLQVTHWMAAAWLRRGQPPLVYSTTGAQPPVTLAFAKGMAGSCWYLTDTVLLEVALGVLALASALLGFGPAAATVWAVIAGAVALGLAARFALGVRKLGSEKASAKFERELLAQLDAGQPQAVIFMSGDAGMSTYIVNQWVPTMEQLPYPAFLIMREASHLAPLDPTPMTVVYASKTRHVEVLCRPTVRVAYYLANGGRNVQLLREARIRHVFLNHGDSDKSTSANPVARVYDEVWVAGQAAIDRYDAAGVEIARSKYAIIGRPQVEGLRVGPLGEADRPVTVLYAPTFEGYYQESNYSSLEYMGPAMIRHILENHPDVRVIFKPHPASGVQRPGMATARIEIVDMLAAAPGDHLYVTMESNLSLFDCFNQSHLLISDISSVVTDFLYSERPLITTNPRELDPDVFRRTFPTQAASYILERDLSNFPELLNDALGADSLRAQRIDMKKYVLGDLPAGPTAAFVVEAQRASEAAAAHAASIVNEFRVRD